MIKPRLIERWLTITGIGIESTRDRTPMTPFPAPNASLLPTDVDREYFLHSRGSGCGS